MRILFILMLLLQPYLAIADGAKYTDYFDTPQGTVRTYKVQGGKDIEVTTKLREVRGDTISILYFLKVGERVGVSVERIEQSGYWRGPSAAKGAYFFKGELKKDSTYVPKTGVTLKVLFVGEDVQILGKKHKCLAIKYVEKNLIFYFAKGLGIVQIKAEVVMGGPPKTVDVFTLSRLQLPAAK